MTGRPLAALIVKVTEMVSGLFADPAAVISTEPVYVPGAMPAGATAIVREAGAVPERGVAVNQDAVDTADQFSVPPPVLDMLTDCAGVAAPPAT